MTIDDLRDYRGDLVIKVTVDGEDRFVRVVGMNSTYNIIHLEVT